MSWRQILGVAMLAIPIVGVRFFYVRYIEWRWFFEVFFMLVLFLVGVLGIHLIVTP